MPSHIFLFRAPLLVATVRMSGASKSTTVFSAIRLRKMTSGAKDVNHSSTWCTFRTFPTPPKRLLASASTTDKTTKKASDSQSEEEKHRDAEKHPLPEWPGGVNPHTGEKGGPRGPEPTRFGDWERKGRVSDF